MQRSFCKQELRKPISDISSHLTGDLEVVEHAKMAVPTTKHAECECCGIKEECTSEYVSQVKGTHLDKWVCGLCSEAVKERLERAPELPMNEAISSHKRFFEEFNTTRLNPMLSLTCSIRNIVRKSYVRKVMWQSTDDMSSCMRYSSSSSMGMKLAHSSNCVPRVNG